MNELKICDINVNDIRYADDTVLLEDAEQDLQNLLDKFEIKSEK